MSTRATVHFQEAGETQAIVYRHSDGYPKGLGVDLKAFLDEVKANLTDTRFDNASYLAAKFVVWQAKRYAEDHYLNFLSLGIVLQDPGDIEYRYLVECSGKRPTIKCEPTR